MFFLAAIWMTGAGMVWMERCTATTVGSGIEINLKSMISTVFVLVLRTEVIWTVPLVSKAV